MGGRDPTRTWNQGLAYAKGDFVCLIGDDDYISSNYIAEMTSLIGTNPGAALYRARLCVVDRFGETLYYGLNLPAKESWDEYLYFRFRYGRPNSTCEFVAEASALRAIGGYISSPMAWGSDDATWATLAVVGGIISTNEAFGYWRNHETNISSMGCSSDRMHAILASMSWHKEFLAVHQPSHIPQKILNAELTERFETLITSNEKDRSKLFSSLRRLAQWLFQHSHKHLFEL
jgi:hypothetical protein